MVHTLGVIASITGMAVALSPLLQLRLILIRKHSDDVSIGFLCVIVVGVAMWSAYGFAQGDLFLAIPNAVSTLCNAGAVLVAWHYRGKGAEATK